MTTELTTEILQQIRADIADVKGDIADLKERVDRGFDRVDTQFLAVMELIGTLLRKDQEHDRRLDALESR